MQLIIHKGALEIGGTCIQLSQDDTALLLDLGLPLRERRTKVLKGPQDRRGRSGHQWTWDKRGVLQSETYT